MRRTWQALLIAGVIGVTVYNILPTLFYYSKPLSSPIDQDRAKECVENMERRVADLRGQGIEWVGSFCQLLGVSPVGIEETAEGAIRVSFAQEKEAALVSSHLPRAGALLPFPPAQLALLPSAEANVVLVQRLVSSPPVAARHLDFAPLGSKAMEEVAIGRGKAILKALLGGGETDLRLDAGRPLVLNDAAFASFTLDVERGQFILTPRQGVSADACTEPLARVVSETHEEFRWEGGRCVAPFLDSEGGTGCLFAPVAAVGLEAAAELRQLVAAVWHPQHPDLQRSAFPVVDREGYARLPADQQALCLWIDAALPEGTARPGSVYVVARGLQRIAESVEAQGSREMAELFAADVAHLQQILQPRSFFGYPGGALNQGASYGRDWVFETRDVSGRWFAATREAFKLKGPFALLALSDVEQRILTENKIETEIHNDLLKWDEEHRASQVSLNGRARYDVPKPTRSPFWSNTFLSFRKLFRGDERKILRWGLDLSGGKSVQIELRDAQGLPVTGEEEIKQGISELYARVNKMGLSEVSIRQLGSQIALDFPGSQHFSASELIKASSMHFHVVNEKFSSPFSPLAEKAQRFLQEVWNEAVVAKKTDPDSLQLFAWRRLYGEGKDRSEPAPRSEAAAALLEEGLLLASPFAPEAASSAVDDQLTRIARFRSESEWHQSRHPLLLVFNHFALEGSNLANIHAGYDPAKGNFLAFDVAPSALRGGKKISPREELYAWTSRFSKSAISGSPYEEWSRGRPWRMAVILNGSVISAPQLEEALRTSASITGSFTQREVNHLAADLKAGSMTFTPHILSEQNISPELGRADRMQGISASVLALALVFLSMIAYYRFAGWIASVAVLFNLLILWATLQNLGAALSLAGIAGIILTMGMAVDANVLVFERFKEEYARIGQVGPALRAGYQKAFAAILDSNLTTIIAGLILLNFDAGPVKGFALALIIGIASSMFTALFMTRYYFDGWVAKHPNRPLHMMSWLTGTAYDFLKQSRSVIYASLLLIGIGGSLAWAYKGTLFGMDFTGGYAVELRLSHPPADPVEQVRAALIAEGADARDIQVRQLSSPTHLRLCFSTGMEQPGRPFATALDAFESAANPRLAWIGAALAKQGVTVDRALMEASWTAMSGQMSAAMRTHAVVGLALAFLCIFLYIAYRFESAFAWSALLCLAHDVAITLACVGIGNALGLPVQIDLNTIAAILTIVGYSLNDTIIIFDRIREEMGRQGERRLPLLINRCLNATLSRTAITSGTTLLVLLALLLFGGASIFSFALVMTLGVFFGTLSSWYVAAPLFLFFYKRGTPHVTQQLVAGSPNKTAGLDDLS